MSDTNEAKYFHRWYEANKEGFNARRRMRYRSDPEYRDKLVERQREARAKHPRPSQAKDYSIRVVGGSKKKVFRIGYVVEAIGRSEMTIRNWERKGIIPKPSVVSQHRYYTKRQVKLLKELSELLTQVRYNPKLRDFAIHQKSNEIYGMWEQD